MKSAGVLLFRRRPTGLEVFLVHPGGPFYSRRDDGVWSIPKGAIESGEEPLAVALREFEEETGASPRHCSAGDPVSLGEIRQRGGKWVEAWAMEGDWPEGRALRSNRFTLEWPPRSGKIAEFPEADRGGFFGLAEARRKMLPAQWELVERLQRLLAEERAGSADPPSADPSLRSDPGRSRRRSPGRSARSSR